MQILNVHHHTCALPSYGNNIICFLCAMCAHQCVDYEHVAVSVEGVDVAVIVEGIDMAVVWRG